MDRRDASLPLFWLGIATLLVSLLSAFFVGSNSASGIEKRVSRAVSGTLEGAQLDWPVVKVDGQKVILSGVAPSESERNIAVTQALQSIGKGGLVQGGVTKVVDRIDVAPHVDPFVWGVEVLEGKATLYGYAPSKDARRAIASTAETHFGDELINEMQLGSGAPGGDAWVDLARLGLGQASMLETGKAELVDAMLRVEGVTRDHKAKEQIESALLGVVGPFSAVSVVSGPYHWAAQHDGNTLRMLGALPNEATRRLMIEIIANGFEGEFLDETVLSDRDGWQSHAVMGLRHILTFENGSVSLVDDTFHFTGDASNSVFDFLKQDVQRLPAPFSAQLDINTIAPTLIEIEGIDFDVDGKEKEDACQLAFVRIMSANRIYFEVDSAGIDRKSGQTLDKLIAVARQCRDLSIVIEGHTDDRGPRELNLELSRRRADAVRSYFVSKGMGADKLKAVGFGPDRPADTNSTSIGRQNNRRIEFKIDKAEDR